MTKYNKIRQEYEVMTLGEHLDALRGIIVKSLLTLTVISIVYFYYSDELFSLFILSPANGDAPVYKISDFIEALFSNSIKETESYKLNLININIAAPLFIQMGASLLSALLTIFPYIIYLIWTFLAPALYSSEKKGVKQAFMFSSLLFYLGAATGYFLLFPITLRFLTTVQIAEIPNTITLQSYMSLFWTLIFIMGAAFELPILTWLLAKIGIIKPVFFSKYRKYAIVIILIAAAVITPTPDPFTMMAVFIPLYILYETSAIIVTKTVTGSKKATKTL
ncbi:MAG: twin-arginine translocase subunit TatC [Bacteroidales bacterium]